MAANPEDIELDDAEDAEEEGGEGAAADKAPDIQLEEKAVPVQPRPARAPGARHAAEMILVTRRSARPAPAVLAVEGLRGSVRACAQEAVYGAAGGGEVALGALDRFRKKQRVGES